MGAGQEPLTGRAATGGRSVAPTRFLIQTDQDKCRECWACVRYCPARAIRVIGGRSEIIEERCVKCGACVSECGNNGRAVRDDTPKVRALLASHRPVVALLATEFVAALHPMSPNDVERALESIGFFAVETTPLGEELVAGAYERSLTRPCASLMLRSTCPVAVDWVRKFYPSLVPALMPVVPPYVAQARLVRALYSEDTAIVYVSPCYARKDEIHEPEIAGLIDAAIDFTELERLIRDVTPRPPYATAGGAGERRPVPIKEMSLTDGFPRKMLEQHDATDPVIIAVRGLRQLDTLLQAVSRGEAAPAVIDMLNCEGCIDGPAVRPGLSVFAKRNIVAAEREASVHPTVSTRDLLGYLPRVDMVRSFTARPAPVCAPTPSQIDAELVTGGFPSREDTLDCGACGYTSCIEHAVAIIDGNSTWEMCFPQQRRRMEATSALLAESAMRDALTGLGNRRAFDERLAEEVARTVRYGGPLSLVMLDVDTFKAVNDTYGHPVGDSVLTDVGMLIRQSLRETDIATRYGGDEFALILPGITKTEAFAVAEKLRLAVAAHGFKVSEAGASHVRVAISAGVASARQDNADVLGLLEAADRALYSAKQAGRNQVRLAAG